MAASYFNSLASPSRACAIAAVTDPTGTFEDLVRVAMREVQPAMVLLPPTRLTAQLEACAAQGIRLVAFGDSRSATGPLWSDWDISAPTNQTLERVREVRDSIRLSVETFIRGEGWQSS
jgi:arsenate reductase (thioredoxin)